jgi:hypothetical protein
VLGTPRGSPRRKSARTPSPSVARGPSQPAGAEPFAHRRTAASVANHRPTSAPAIVPDVSTLSALGLHGPVPSLSTAHVLRPGVRPTLSRILGPPQVSARKPPETTPAKGVSTNSAKERQRAGKSARKAIKPLGGPAHGDGSAALKRANERLGVGRQKTRSLNQLEC